ncbi:4'-phosphopantetheinyl transferase [Streptomyces sp. NPDC051567]|uniref:4'-phosphopantetheinyl transferase n=1 Tax=Streptomyces sp. NPDC051567 TaxID=3365660 RepID=UPI00379B7849
MIGDLLPVRVKTVEALGDAPTSSMFPVEAAVVARAVDKRRREFTTVRVCARQALGRLGIAPTPILPGMHGAPRWPAGIVGSMTHCTGYRAAAVARSADLATIGVDAEPNSPLPNVRILKKVTHAEERDQIARLNAHRSDICWDRLFFSAKESVFKAWHPLTGRVLDFLAATVTVHPESGTFTAALLAPGPFVDGIQLSAFTGGWRVREGIIVTAIAVPRKGIGPAGPGRRPGRRPSGGPGATAA